MTVALGSIAKGSIADTPVAAGGGPSAIAGTAALAFGAGSSALKGKAALAGSSTTAFGTGSTTLTGKGTLVGQSDVLFTLAGILQNAAEGAMAGSSAIVFGAGSSTLTGKGALAGSGAATFGAGASTITGKGALTGQADVLFTLAGALDGLLAGSISGSSAILITPTGTLTGTGALAGTASLSFSLAGEMPSGIRGHAFRRWRSRLTRQRTDGLQIRDRKELLAAIAEALAELEKKPETKTKAAKVRQGLLKADSAKRRSLLQIDTKAIEKQLDDVLWALERYEEQLAREAEMVRQAEESAAEAARRVRRKQRDEEAIIAILEALNQGRWLI